MSEKKVKQLGWEDFVNFARFVARFTHFGARLAPQH